MRDVDAVSLRAFNEEGSAGGDIEETLRDLGVVIELPDVSLDDEDVHHYDYRD